MPDPDQATSTASASPKAPSETASARAEVEPAPSGGSAANAPPATAPSRAPLVGIDTLLLVFFAASGCAALIYEVVWLHLLRLVVGASALSLGILLASFMGGMFLGSLMLSRLVPAKWHPLKVYGAIELGIGAFGLLMPLLVPGARAVYFTAVGHGVLSIVVRGLVAGVLLLPPTALMGATLPAIARRYSAGSRGMSKLAFLYATNTAGAVAGCLLTAFYLLPNWDIVVATGVAVAINVVLGLAAWKFAPLFPPRAEEPTDAAPAPAASGGDLKIHPIHVVVALSGLTSLGAQVVWTRLLAILFGGTTYTFAILLGVFLGGLGIGSAVAAGAIRRGARPAVLLGWTQLGLVVALTYAGAMIAEVIPYTNTLRVVPIHALWILHTLYATAVTLPATVLWGMSFPLALAAASSGADTGRSSGNVYAANTVGAIVGAVGTSFFLIPTFGTRAAEQSFVVIAAVGGVLALAWSWESGVGAASSTGAAAPAKGTAQAAGKDAFTTLAVLAAVVTAVCARALPGLPDRFQADGRYIWIINDTDKFPYVAEGASSTVAVRESNGHRYFHVAGKVEASNDPQDSRLERLLGHLSALAHPHPKSVLVVGLGAGITAGTFVLHPEIERIVICEIEPRVVQVASKYFGAENYNVLSDPRVQIVHDDARHFLATTQEHFDIITSDPIHPWVRGNSVLFSREYYNIVKTKLAPGGIATQWVPLYETSAAAIQIQVRTFMDAFPKGMVFNSQEKNAGYDVVLLGQIQPAPLDVLAMQRRIDANPHLRQSLADVKLGSAVDMLATFGIGSSDLGGWLAGAEVNRDFSLRLEYISGLAFNLQIADDIYSGMIRGRKFPTGLFVAPKPILAELERRIIGTPPVQANAPPAPPPMASPAPAEAEAAPAAGSDAPPAAPDTPAAPE